MADFTQLLLQAQQGEDGPFKKPSLSLSRLMGCADNARKNALQQLNQLEATNLVSLLVLAGLFSHGVRIVSSLSFQTQYLGLLSMELVNESKPEVARQLAGIMLKNCVSSRVRNLVFAFISVLTVSFSLFISSELPLLKPLRSLM